MRFKPLATLIILSLTFFSNAVSADDLPVIPPCIITASTFKTTDITPVSAQDMYNHPEKYTGIPTCDVNKGVTLDASVDANRNGIIDSLEKATPTPKPVPVAAAATPAPTPTATPTPSASPSPSPTPAKATPTPDTKVAAANVKKAPAMWIFILIAVLILTIGFAVDYWLRRKKVQPKIELKPKEDRSTTRP